MQFVNHSLLPRLGVSQARSPRPLRLAPSRARNVLIVSPYFPPSTLASVHRARHLAKRLPEAGWTPIILCVDERRHGQPLDPSLAELVPQSIEVIKVGALPATLTRWFGLGDVGLRAYGPLRAAIRRILAARRIDAVLITGAPFYPMMLAAAIDRAFNVPVVLDFQDPWASDWGRAQPRFSKAGVSHRLATWLEPQALKRAAFVTSVSSTQNAALCARYSWLDAARMAAIPIGCDWDDFEALRQTPEALKAVALDPAFINLSYVGAFMPRSVEPMRTLFRAFRRISRASPDLAARIRLNFVGTSNQPGDTASFRARALAESESVGESVREIPGRRPYLEALGVLARSDGLLLIGSDEPHYAASKIHPSLMSGTPYVSLFHRASDAHHALCRLGGGETLSFDGQAELKGLEPALSAALRRIATAPGASRASVAEVDAQCGASAVARRFAEVFDHVVESWT